MDAQAEPERDFVLSCVKPVFIVFNGTSNVNLQYVPELQVPIDSRETAQKANRRQGPSRQSY